MSLFDKMRLYSKHERGETECNMCLCGRALQEGSFGIFGKQRRDLADQVEQLIPVLLGPSGVPLQRVEEMEQRLCLARGPGIGKKHSDRDVQMLGDALHSVKARGMSMLDLLQGGFGDLQFFRKIDQGALVQRTERDQIFRQILRCAHKIPFFPH